MLNSKALEAKDQTIRILEEVVDTLAQVERLAQAEVTIAKLEGELRLRDEQIKTLKREIETLNSFRPSSTPLYYTEEEEEAKYMLDRGMIDSSQYEEILAAAGFDNAEIEFAPEDYPRLSAAVPSS